MLSVCQSVCIPQKYLGDLNAVPFNPAVSTIPKLRTFKLLRWMKNLNQTTWEHDMHADRSSNYKQPSLRPFLQKYLQKYERGGRYKIKIHIVFKNT
jgi:hypothetical protein